MPRSSAILMTETARSRPGPPYAPVNPKHPSPIAELTNFVLPGTRGSMNVSTNCGQYGYGHIPQLYGRSGRLALLPRYRRLTWPVISSLRLDGSPGTGRCGT